MLLVANMMTECLIWILVAGALRSRWLVEADKADGASDGEAGDMEEGEAPAEAASAAAELAEQEALNR